MQVAQVWRYPVKSMQGERLDALEIGDDRVAGDRTWGVRDSATGTVLTGRATRPLLHASAAVDGDGVRVTFPDGRALHSDDPDVDLALSSLVGQPVHLAHAKDDEQATFSTVSEFGSPGQTVRWQSVPGSFNDGAAVHVLTTASLRGGALLHPAGEWDVRRFRPNVLVDVPGDEFAEDDWHTVCIGPAELSVCMQTPRCSITSRSQPGLLDDLEVPRALARNRKAKLGVYADVTRAGVISVGDHVQVVP
jgi:uncharacterized protein YcbX